MKLLDIFSGTGSISNVFKDANHDILTIDNDKQFKVDICKDILNVSVDEIISIFGVPDVIWASPPCTTFSIASVRYHWKRVYDIEKYKELDNYVCKEFPYIPKSESCIIGVKLLEYTIDIINKLNPQFYFIENPRGMMRKHPLVNKLNRSTITYCQYGDNRMKPTDIFGKFPNSLIFKPMCKNGDSCHESAPRGSCTGTQGIKLVKNRSKVPRELCLSILNACEKDIKV